MYNINNISALAHNVELNIKQKAYALREFISMVAHIKELEEQVNFYQHSVSDCIRADEFGVIFEAKGTDRNKVCEICKYNFKKTNDWCVKCVKTDSEYPNFEYYR